MGGGVGGVSAAFHICCALKLAGPSLLGTLKSALLAQSFLGIY